MFRFIKFFYLTLIIVFYMHCHSYACFNERTFKKVPTLILLFYCSWWCPLYFEYDDLVLEIDKLIFDGLIRISTVCYQLEFIFFRITSCWWIFLSWILLHLLCCLFIIEIRYIYFNRMAFETIQPITPVSSRCFMRWYTGDLISNLIKQDVVGFNVFHLILNKISLIFGLFTCRTLYQSSCFFVDINILSYLLLVLWM